MGIFNAMKGKEEFLQAPLALPKKFNLSNFISAFTRFEVFGVNLLGMFGNSIVLTVCATFLSVASCTCTAYCVVKYRFIGRKLIYFLAIMIMLIPTIGSMPAMYKLVNTLGIKDNVVGVSLLWGSGFGFNFLLLYSYFKNVSGAYSEAAKVDGARGFYDIFQNYFAAGCPCNGSGFDSYGYRGVERLSHTFPVFGKFADNCVRAV